MKSHVQVAVIGGGVVGCSVLYHLTKYGWKDVVLLRPFETVRIIKRFDDYADPVNPFMFHCHILEHEDVGMMGQFVVEQG